MGRVLLFITFGAVRVLAGGGGGPGVMLYKGMTGPAKSSGEQDGVLNRGGGWCFSPWVAFTHTYFTDTDTNTVSGLLCASSMGAVESKVSSAILSIDAITSSTLADGLL